MRLVLGLQENIFVLRRLIAYLTPALGKTRFILLLPLAQRVHREVIEDDRVRSELRVTHQVRLELEVDWRGRRCLVLLDEGLYSLEDRMADTPWSILA